MRKLEDSLVPVAGSNQEMAEAIDQARASIGKFFQAFENPRPGQSSFLIKARFQQASASEHIWLADLDFSTTPATGVISNEPEIPTLTYLQRVAFLPDQISDWLYLENGRIVGGYTTRVLLRAAARRNGLKDLTRPAYLM